MATDPHFARLQCRSRPQPPAADFKPPGDVLPDRDEDATLPEEGDFWTEPDEFDG